VTSLDAAILSHGNSHPRRGSRKRLAGAALGGATIQGIHAQAKPKAYTVSEIETLDAAAQQAYVPQIPAAIKAAGGRTFNTAGGRIAAIVGEAPKRVAINEWDETL